MQEQSIIQPSGNDLLLTPRSSTLASIEEAIWDIQWHRVLPKTVRQDLLVRCIWFDRHDTSVLLERVVTESSLILDMAEE